MPSRGFKITPIPQIPEAVETILTLLYRDIYRKLRPLNDPKTNRNAQIRALHNAGWSGPQIAAHFGISSARVYQVLYSDK